MKHTWKVSLLMVVLFLVAQFVGLFIVNQYIATEITVSDGVTHEEKTYTGLPYDIERPEFQEQTSFIPITIIILIATCIILMIAKFKLLKLWKFWFFLSVWFCLLIAFGAFMGQALALGIAFVLAFIKVLRTNMFIHNLTEVFLYGGLAAIFAPVFNVFSIAIFLIIIAVYDMIAVWHTKHMVALAKFQSKSKLFAGLFIKYGKKNAVLGGGDIGFPLIFAAVVMKTFGAIALIIPITTAVALGCLLYFSEKNKFYPAMPFLAVGCFLGYGIVLLI